MARLFFEDAAINEKYQKKNSMVDNCQMYLRGTILKASSVHLPLLIVEYPQVNG